MGENAKNEPEDIDWSLTTWEGSRRHQLRHWASLPLETIVTALEDMEELNRLFSDNRTVRSSGGNKA